MPKLATSHYQQPRLRRPVKHWAIAEFFFLKGSLPSWRLNRGQEWRDQLKTYHERYQNDTWSLADKFKSAPKKSVSDWDWQRDQQKCWKWKIQSKDQTNKQKVTNKPKHWKGSIAEARKENSCWGHLTWDSNTLKHKKNSKAKTSKSSGIHSRN